MASASEDDIMDAGDDDLFGSDDDSGEKARELSDKELDSGDDEDRNDRASARDEGEEEQYDTRDVVVQDSTVWRQLLPQPINGEVRSLFLKIASKLIFYSSTHYGCPNFWVLPPSLSNPTRSKYLNTITIQRPSLPISLPTLQHFPPCDIVKTRQPESSKAILSFTSGAMEALLLP